jgi:hypothetical protein
MLPWYIYSACSIAALIYPARLAIYRDTVKR